MEPEYQASPYELAKQWLFGRELVEYREAWQEAKVTYVGSVLWGKIAITTRYGCSYSGLYARGYLGDTFHYKIRRNNAAEPKAMSLGTCT